jgi:hypothetical protein
MHIFDSWVIIFLILSYQVTFEPDEVYPAKKGPKSSPVIFSVSYQGCQIFLGTTYQNGEKYTKWPQNVPNGYRHTYIIYHLVIKRSNCPKNAIILHCKTFQNLPNFVFLVWKYTIWQTLFLAAVICTRLFSLRCPKTLEFEQTNVLCGDAD